MPTPKEIAERIIVELHAEYVTDADDCGTYVLNLTEYQTQQFFKDVARRIESALTSENPT